MVKEMEQVTGQVNALKVKLADDKEKIVMQKKQNEQIMQTLQTTRTSIGQGELECNDLVAQHTELKRQIADLEVKHKDMAKYPDHLEAHQNMQRELESEIADMKAELLKVKPEPQQIPAKVHITNTCRY